MSHQSGRVAPIVIRDARDLLDFDDEADLRWRTTLAHGSPGKRPERPTLGQERPE